MTSVANTTCCICFPILCGLKFLAVIDVIGMALNIIVAIAAVMAATAIAGMNVYVILIVLIVIPDVVAGVLCCKWLCNNGKEERKGLM